MASIEEVQKRALKAARRKALSAVRVSAVAAAAQIVTEFVSTVGATGMLGLAVHLPYGVLRTAAAGFAGLAAVRYFLIPVRPKQSAPTPPPAALPHVGADELDQLYKTLESLGYGKSQDAKAPAHAAGPYL